MSLMDQFKAKMEKSKISGANTEANFDVMYPTGFLSIDYLNGTIVHVDSPERSFSYNATGIVDGSTNTIIGRSGSGKSTLAIQIAANIIRPFIEKGMEATLFIDDLESSLPQSRKEFLMDMSIEDIEKYVVIRNSGITTENVYERIKTIADTKINNKKEFQYDTELYDTYGNRIYKLVPTVYLIDSLPMLLPEDLSDDDELGGSMDSSSIAKKNTMLLKKISQLCKEANIIIISINHILDDINIGFTPKPSMISGLKQGERLPGGKAVLYLANNMFRTDDSLTLKPTEGFGIDGSVVNLTIIKSRTNVSKKSVPLIFNKTLGMYDPILSLFYLLKQEGRLSGAGVSLYFNSRPDIKFSQKNFKDKLENSPELQEAFAKESYDLLSTYLSDTRRVHQDSSNAYNKISDLINGFGNNNSN